MMNNFICQRDRHGVSLGLHGVDGIDTQIDQELIDLSGVADDGIDIGCQRFFDFYIGRKGGPNQFQGTSYHRYGIKRFFMRVIFAAKGQKLSDHISGPKRGRHYLIDIR